MADDSRAFKRRKRAQFRALKKTADAFMNGVALTPREAYVAWSRVEAALNEIESVCKPWWRGA
jgi:hypothetical protein